MNKSAIQKFATWARTELIAQVSQRAYQYGITKDGYGEADAVTVGGRALTSDEAKERGELVTQIRQKGYAQVMEEVAYTWFNRFIALRFMEVNNYLPSHIRIFSDSTGAFKPEILSDALHLDLPGLDKEKVSAYIESNQTEELYRYLLLTQCNALNVALPRMFEKMGGYTELLFPNNILKPDSVLARMVTDIPEEDWTDQVQIIGWLYQYYNAELKDETFALLKKNVKVTKERIPSATQLFTPDWIVRYMVENSLGRMFISGQLGVVSGQTEVASGQLTEEERIEREKVLAGEMGWKYYLPEAAQEPEVRAQLNQLAADTCSLADLRIIDPCMGSGHILVYAFDLLIQIYKKFGVSERDAAQSILQNNLYGLDIDDRAAQLAYFAVMMKARQYDRRIFSRGIQPHVYAIAESNGLDAAAVGYFTNSDPKLKKDFGTLADELRDAKEYGSILNITPVDFAALYARVEEVREEISLYRENVLSTVLPLIQVAEVMARKYDVVVTNPPYMGSSNMDAKLSEFAKKHYPNSKSDLFACFIEKGNRMAGNARFNCMVTMQSWMFLSSFEKMRTQTLMSHDIVTLMHMENMVLGIAFGTAVTVFRNHYTPGYKGTYNQIKLCDVENGKPIEFPVEGNRFAQVSTDNFSKIPGSPVAYWVSEAVINDFSGNSISTYGWTSKGIITGNNEQFLRLWYEISKPNINFYAQTYVDSFKSDLKWYPCNKGGDFRKWFGNSAFVINWYHNGEEIMQRNVPKTRNCQDYKDECKFVKSITWTSISSSKPSFRLSEKMLSESAGMTLFIDEKILWYALAFLNSCVAEFLLVVINPTLNFTAGSISSLPLIEDHTDHMNKVNSSTKENIAISCTDWNSYETSWDFKRHPMV